MLVLGRQTGQAINIGGGVTIHVLRTQAKQVRIGIEAPSHVRVLRGELRESVPESQTNMEDEIKWL